MLMLLAMIFAIARRWRMATLTGMIAAIAFVVWLLPFYHGAGSVSAKSHTLRILSANLDCNSPSPEKFIDLVNETRPQIVLLFELTRAWAPVLQEKLTAYPYSHVSPSAGRSGCGIFSTLPIDEVSVQAIGPYPNFVVVAKLAVGGQQIRIFGTHPLAPYTPGEMRARNEQLAELAKTVGQKSVRTIVAGDFNTSSWSPCFNDLAKATGLRDTRKGFGVLPTFPSYLWPVRTTIDHCLVSADIEVLDRWVGPNIDSDHLPIFVDLQLPDFPK